MRRGKVQGVVEKEETNERELARMMVGRDVVLEIERVKAKPGDVVFEVRDLTVKSKRGIVALNDVSFNVREGEIVAIAGVEGNGQTELISTMLGFLRPLKGTIDINGNEMKFVTSYDIRKKGLAYITEDRKRRGLIFNTEQERMLF